MFWRNNYSYKDAFLNYFDNKNRTNFIYADSSSYRIRSEITNCKNPNLSRLPIREDGKPNSINEIGMSKSFNNKFRTSETKSPNHRKVLTNTDRVLRPRIHTPTSSSFVREFNDNNKRSIRSSYEIGALNTNFNNSGSDDLNDIQSTTTELCSYDVSGDEDLSDAQNRHIMRESNNANSNGVGKTRLKQTSTQWFQRNIYGLPNEESDDLNQDLSGAISGDEQYDGAYEESNLNNTLRKTKSQSSRVRKSDSFNSKKNIILSDTLLSPLAVLMFVLEWVWQLVITSVRFVIHTAVRVTHSTRLNCWLTAIIFFPVAFIKTIIALSAYSTDRLIGTSFRRRLYSRNRLSNSLFSNWLYKTSWLLIFPAVIFFGWYYFMGTQNISISQPVSSIRGTLSKYVYHMVGRNCMIKDDCCHTNMDYIQRFTTCLFSLPSRLTISENDQLPLTINTYQSSKESSNISNLEDILENIKSHLEDHDLKFSIYNGRLENFKEDSKMKYDSNQLSITNILDLAKNIESVRENLTVFQDQFEQFKLEKTLFQKSIDNLVYNQKESIVLTSKDLSEFKEKQEKYAQAMDDLVDKTEQSSEMNSASISNLEKLLHQLRVDMDHFKIRLNEIHNKTISLEESNEKLVVESDKFQKEIINEFRSYKASQNLIIVKLNEEMSKLENTLNENHSKMHDKTYLDELIIHHLESVKSNLKNEINSTLWSNLTDHISTVLTTTKVNYQPVQANTNDSRFCTCFPPKYRCSRTCATCVRAHHVRKLLNDAFTLFSSDKIGIADFALESAGGTIASTRCTETYTDRASTLTVFGIPLLKLTNSPRTIIQPNLNPGECWPMKGTRGAVVVQLSAKITISAVSIDHIPKSLSPSESIDSAIQDFEIKALENESDITGVSLGNFTYLSDSTPIQTFSVQKQIETKFVELIINSNYGNKDYTCIYRFRVHGKLVEM